MMRGWIQRQPLIALLAALVVLLAIIVGVELGFGTRLRSAVESAPRKAPLAEAKLLPPIAAVVPEEAYPETIGRPLFTPTRRPAPEAPVAAQKAFKRDQFVLQGVIVVGDNRVAMLREKASGRIHRVERGKEVNGITVFEIEPESVTLGEGGERETLALVVQKAAGAPPIVAPQGPFAAAGAPSVPTNPAAYPQPSQPGTQQGATPVAPANPLAGSTAGPIATQPEQRVPAQGYPAQAGSAPVTPEELLARRRARRSQQSQ